MKHRIAGLLALLLLLSAALPIYGCKQAADTEAPSATQTPQSTPVSQTPADTDAPAPSTFLAKAVNTRSIGNMNYWLYTPSAPTEAMPLIVYLHGGSGKGDDPELITNADGFPKYLRDGTLGNLRAYVIIPQLPSSQKGWANIADAFRYPVRFGMPSFSMTVVHRKPENPKRKHPDITVYIDGPFYADSTLPDRAQARDLRNRIHAVMTGHAKESDYEKIRYVRRTEDEHE